ncbi:unnamed protein product [Rhodiola kirilowii]
MNGDGVSWGSSLKPLWKFMEEKAPKHTRNLSDVPDIKLGEDVKECIFAAPLRQKLEMGQENRSHESWKMPVSTLEVHGQDRQKPAEDLIKEIATLEMQVARLEQHLLSLYRKKFDQQVSPNKDNNLQSTSARFWVEDPGSNVRRRDDKLNYSSHFADQQLSKVSDKNEFQSTSARFVSEQHGRQISSLLSKDLQTQFNSARFLSEHCRDDIKRKKDDKLDLSDHSVPQNFENPVKKGTEKWGEQKILDSSINRTHSSLSHNFAVKYSTIQRIVAEAAQSDHSLPLSLFEAHDATSGEINNGKRLEVTDSSSQVANVPETPNWLSEEMIKCISTIYCTLADPPLNCHNKCSSPFSFSSAMDEFSPENATEMWNTHSMGSHLENSFVNEKLRFSGTYCSMVEVKHISEESKKLRDAEDTLQRFRGLVTRLDKVDPRKLKNRQKLAFWINVHNALVMHAFLVYGIPENNLKRMSLVLKAAYNVGGQTINVEMIQRSLLGCRMPRPGQWLQSFLFPKTKFKVSDPRKLFAIDHSEPLLHFALCAGSHSDPAVRVYTPMRVYQELEAAKDDYIQLALRVQKEDKILLPKTVELFSKDCDLNPAGFMEMLEPFLPTSLRKSIKQKHRAKLWKSIQWIPHNFAFRYLFSRDLVA